MTTITIIWPSICRSWSIMLDRNGTYYDVLANLQDSVAEVFVDCHYSARRNDFDIHSTDHRCIFDRRPDDNCHETF